MKARHSLESDANWLRALEIPGGEAFRVLPGFRRLDTFDRTDEESQRLFGGFVFDALFNSDLLAPLANLLEDDVLNMKMNPDRTPKQTFTADERATHDARQLQVDVVKIIGRTHQYLVKEKGMRPQRAKRLLRGHAESRHDTVLLQYHELLERLGQAAVTLDQDSPFIEAALPKDLLALPTRTWSPTQYPELRNMPLRDKISLDSHDYNHRIDRFLYESDTVLTTIHILGDTIRRGR